MISTIPGKEEHLVSFGQMDPQNIPSVSPEFSGMWENDYKHGQGSGGILATVFPTFFPKSSVLCGGGFLFREHGCLGATTRGHSARKNAGICTGDKIETMLFQAIPL